MEGKTRFVWLDGQETWHKTYTAPHYPQWEMLVAEDHPHLPPGDHTFEVRMDQDEAYYQEVERKP
jgi:hypothetical protein